MIYDRVIRIFRRISWGLSAANLGALVLNLWAHNWIVAFACGVWLCNMLAMVRQLKTLQETRDRERAIARMIDAGLSAMRIETGEY